MNSTRLPGSLRSTVLLLLTSIVGALAFTWPLFITSSASLAGAHSTDAPWVIVLMVPLCLALLASELSSGTFDAKAVAVLALLAACGAVLRIPSPGVAGLEPFLFLVICAGRVFGRSFGFLVAMSSLFVSALFTSGVGPWLPFQMLAAGWIGVLAGSLPPLRAKREIAMLAVAAAIGSLLYGMCMDLWFWPFQTGIATSVSYIPGAGVVANVHRFGAFYLTTSLGFDLPRAATNVVLMVLAGPGVLAALRRTARRAAFGAPVIFGQRRGGADPGAVISEESGVPW